MPAVSTGSTPPGPKSTASTAFVSETHIHTTSAPAAASAGEAALRAPSTSLPPVRFHTATSCPALTRFAAIDRPIIPMPKKATRIGVVPPAAQPQKGRLIFERLAVSLKRYPDTNL